MRRTHTQKGITLVALIITIIVLLILAVVAIRAVTGDGIIAHAKNARDNYNQAQIAENGTIQNYVDYITGQLGEKSKETGPLGTAIHTENYGKKVVGFTSKGEGLSTLVWRVFYEDANNVYLISETANKDYPVKSLSFYTSSNGTYTKNPIVEKYNSGADVSSAGQALMPKASSLFTADNKRENIIATAYLCDTQVWDAYTDAAGKASWAMGGPTIELFAKSYNACSLGDTITLGTNTNGYTQNTCSHWFKTNQKNGIYILKSRGWWWLASPSRRDSSHVHLVDDGQRLFQRQRRDHRR